MNFQKITLLVLCCMSIEKKMIQNAQDKTRGKSQKLLIRPLHRTNFNETKQAKLLHTKTTHQAS